MPDGLININGDSVQTLEIIFLTTIITLLPSLIVMMTSFTRYVISFSFLRSALGTQQTPPNLVLIGIALFLTLFTMSPTITQIQKDAYEPYVAEEITQEEFFGRAQVPLKEFMLRNTKPATLEMFCDLAKTDAPEKMDTAAVKTLPLHILVPDLYDLRTAKSIFDRPASLHPLYADRYCCVIHTDVDGHDYVAAIYDLNALQTSFVCDGKWVGAVIFEFGTRFQLVGG